MIYESDDDFGFFQVEPAYLRQTSGQMVEPSASSVAVKVTHVLSGKSEICEDHRSQLKNRETALERLKARLREDWGKTTFL